MKLCTAVQEGCGYKDGKIFHCVHYLSADPRRFKYDFSYICWRCTLKKWALLMFCTKRLYNVAYSLGTSWKLHGMATFTGTERGNSQQYRSLKDWTTFRHMLHHLESIFTLCWTCFLLRIQSDRACCHSRRDTKGWILKVRNFCYDCTVNLWWLGFYIILCNFICILQFCYSRYGFWKMTDWLSIMSETQG